MNVIHYLQKFLLDPMAASERELPPTKHSLGAEAKREKPARRIVSRVIQATLKQQG